MSNIIIQGKDYLAIRRHARNRAVVPILIWWMADDEFRSLYIANGVAGLLHDAGNILIHDLNVDHAARRVTIEPGSGCTEDTVRSALGLPERSINNGLPGGPWTKEWKPFTGYYEKEMVDIKLKNGDIVGMCWPNAGFMNPVGEKVYNPKDYKQIPYNDVAEVRLTHIKRW